MLITPTFCAAWPCAIAAIAVSARAGHITNCLFTLSLLIHYCNVCAESPGVTHRCILKTYDLEGTADRKAERGSLLKKRHCPAYDCHRVCKRHRVREERTVYHDRRL